MDVKPRFVDILEVLNRHGVDFIVVGGLAAVLHGAPVMTKDVDIVHDAAPEKIVPLLSALREMNARYNDPAGRQIVPDADKLQSFRLNLLLTDMGPLDVLRIVGDGLTYADLVSRSEEQQIGDFKVRVLGLEAIIETKLYADRPKDRIAVMFLREILESENSGSPKG